MKLAICGPARSGKDEAAIWLAANTSLRYSLSTSQVIAPVAARHLGLSVEAAFAQRHQDRMLWRRLGDGLRRSDTAYLARQTLIDGDLCVGIRSRLEIEAVRAEKLVDLVIWIARTVPTDPTLQYGPEMADIVIQNYWGVAEFHERLQRLAKSWDILT